jgi:hypothetical protein
VLRQLDARSAAQNGSSASNLYAGIDLISAVLPFGQLWYGEPNAAINAVGYAKFYSRSHHAVIRVYDDAGNVIDTHEHTVQRVLSSRFSLAPGISLCLARISHPVCDDDHQGTKR